ncbi:LANO_0G05930g1_1 [Lachancea nothofagi CBS 11611]|uniref:LANO_0G05930g1_1 n=1 Tax=Lachancea nothofagi CBS 11611 TaxID=1266666 RepID=A0A1G4KGU6_9SACH|nr:LANO_0G05930g1_1 [Lachancea nothofagi CBS 11611]
MTDASTIIVIGVIVGILSSATQSLGLTLQRKASVTHLAHEDCTNKSLYRSSTWQLGLALFLLSNIVGSTVQIATLPLIVLAPLQSCGLLFNSLAAHYLLKERSSWRTPLATLSIVLGGMVIGVVGVTSSNSHSITHSLPELWKLAHEPLFLRWFTSTNILVVLLLVCTWYNRRSLPTVLKGIIYGCCSGTWSAHSLLMAKSVSDIVTHALIHTTGDLKNLKFWILVSIFVSLSLTQLFLLNTGLRHLSTSILYPLVFCIYNLVNIFNGIVFFHDENAPLSRILIVILPGAMSLIAGVVLLSWDQYIVAQHEESASLQDSPHRTSMLSYTSLRPKSVDLSALQASNASTEESNPFYVSLPQASKRDKYSSITSSQRSGRRILSYEQEGILTQMV